MCSRHRRASAERGDGGARMRRLVLAIAGLCVLTAISTAALGPQGKLIFRFDTFGDEQLWTDTLQMQRAVATLSPRAALNAGLKVDVEALPQPVIDAIKGKTVDLDSPAVTLQLLSVSAVVGVIGRIGQSGALESI